MAEILIENVSKSYVSKDGSVQALKNVNLAIESGDIFGIIGMSGAGKSTLVRCMNFLEVPTEGTVSIRGKALSDLSGKDRNDLSAFQSADAEIRSGEYLFSFIYSGQTKRRGQETSPGAFENRRS